jgi:hypothetical protein
MANRYGEAALMAARMETYGKALTAAERWQDAVKKLYPTTPAGQKKAAPRVAFLGLCEAGLVRNMPTGPPTSPNRNKDYAVEAVRLLREDGKRSISQLWATVSAGDTVEHASQMDVVLALWKNGLIVGDE